MDQYIQTWSGSVNESSRLKSYSIFKTQFEHERYLDVISHRTFRITLAKFRTSSHNLRIETGRHDGTAQNDRICQNCRMNAIESEYHFLLVCPKYIHIRRKYFKPYYCHWPTQQKFNSLLNSTSPRVLNNIAKFLFYAEKERHLDNPLM